MGRPANERPESREETPKVGLRSNGVGHGDRSRYMCSFGHPSKDVPEGESISL